MYPDPNPTRLGTSTTRALMAFRPFARATETPVVPVIYEIGVTHPKDLNGRQTSSALHLLDAHPAALVHARPRQECAVEVTISAHATHDLVQRDILCAPFRDRLAET